MRNKRYGVNYHKQQGTVLVIAVFVVTIIVGIAARFTGDFQLAVARAEQHLIHAQLQQYLYSVESFAGWVLIEDAKADNDNGQYEKEGKSGSFDHLEEEWNNELQAPIEEAKVAASLEDALSRFNLNQLTGRPEPYNANGDFSQRYTVAQKRFIRLLQTDPDSLVDSALAQQITDAIIDWIDADNTVSGIGGAENGYYESLEPAYHSANRPFISVTELRQVRGITPEIYAYISTLVVALPNTEGFNLNTALPALLRSLNERNTETPLALADAENLISTRPKVRQEAEDLGQAANEAFESVDAFLNSSGTAQIFGNDPELWPSSEGLRTGSEYFILTAQVEIANYQRQQLSILKREAIDSGFKSSVIRRTREQL